MTLYEHIYPITSKLVAPELADNYAQNVVFVVNNAVVDADGLGCYNPLAEAYYDQNTRRPLLFDELFLVSIPLNQALDFPLVLGRIHNPTVLGVSHGDMRRISYGVYAQLELLLDALQPVTMYLQRQPSVRECTHLHLLSYGLPQADVTARVISYPGTVVERVGGYCRTTNCFYATNGKLLRAYSASSSADEDVSQQVVAFHRKRKLVALTFPDGLHA